MSFGSSSSNVAASAGTSSASTSNSSMDYLAMGTENGMLEVHDLTASQTVYRIAGHTAAVTGIASIRTQELLTCGLDRTIKLWDLRTK
jgi:WD40 repeat protein